MKDKEITKDVVSIINSQGDTAANWRKRDLIRGEAATAPTQHAEDKNMSQKAGVMDAAGLKRPLKKEVKASNDKLLEAWLAAGNKIKRSA